MPSSHLILCRPLLLLPPKTGRAIQKANWLFLCSEINFFPYDLVSYCSVAKSCLTFCDPMDWSTPGSSVHGLLQAKILECCHFLLQGIFTTQGSNPGLLHCRQMLLPSEPPGKIFFGTLHSNGWIFPFLLCFLLLFFSQLFVRPPQTAIFPFCISFSWGWY